MPDQLLFIPGANGAAEFWQPIADLIDHPVKTLISLPGLGVEPRQPSISSFADLVAHVLTSVDRPTAVIAQSMGGVIAVRTALERPALVTHLVLAATSGGIDVEALGALNWRPGYLSSRPDTPAWVLESGPDLSEQLRTLSIPTLVINAALDPLSPVAVGERLVSLLPDARLISYDSDDHWVARAEAASVAAEISTHLAAR